jgi:hypothetical protein
MAQTEFASVAQQAVPLDAVRPHDLPLGPLIAPRNAARVALGCVHVGTAAIKPTLPSVLLGALFRTALHLFAVRRHRSSNGSKLAFNCAYHVTTE